MMTALLQLVVVTVTLLQRTAPAPDVPVRLVTQSAPAPVAQVEVGPIQEEAKVDIASTVVMLLDWTSGLGLNGLICRLIWHRRSVGFSCACVVVTRRVG